VTHVQDAHNIALNRKEYAELSVEQLADLDVEVIVLRSKRAPTRQ
jgi:hypothetical protein